MLATIQTTKAKILVVDFDGVIHSYCSGWQGVDSVNDPPVDGALLFLCNAVKHFRVMIYGSRSKCRKGREAMRRYLQVNLIAEFGDNVGMMIFSKLEFPSQKPPAFLLIDDRAVCFQGIFPAIEELLEFKPWYRA